MALTLEQLETELTETPDLFTQLLEKRTADASKFLTGKGHLVKTKAEYDAELAAEVTKKNQEAIDQEGAKFYRSVDGMLALATGQTKPDKMRTREWVAKLEEDGLLPFSDAQIEKLKAALKGGGSPKGDAVIDGLQKQLEKFQQEKEEGEKKAFQKQVSAVIKADLRAANVPIDPTIKEEAAKNKAKAEAISDLKDFFEAKYESHSDEEGEVYFTKKGSKDPLVNANEARYLSPLEIIKQNHKLLLASEGHQQAGGGTHKPGNGGTGGAKTLTDIYKEAAGQGLAFGTPDWKKFVAEQKKLAGIV
ncbi:hypothetical protein [Larkinella soli]|uniref:hypothetical protein n=1 Tax=Larkinella soli TaxID=1770527 RepID=UPI000FFCA218|nr:hypothetical protein [Larkinella soli]